MGADIGRQVGVDGHDCHATPLLDMLASSSREIGTGGSGLHWDEDMGKQRLLEVMGRMQGPRDVSYCRGPWCCLSIQKKIYFGSRSSTYLYYRQAAEPGRRRVGHHELDKK
jgi:hypothetical protein